MATHLRATNNTGWAAGITIFAILWVAATVIAVVYYSKWDESRRATIAAKDELVKYVTDDDKKVAVVLDMEAKGEQVSVVRQFLNETGDLKHKLVGQRNAPYSAVEKELQAAGIDSATIMLTKVKSLQADLVGANTAANDAAAQIAGVQEKVKTVEAEKSTIKQEFDSTVTTINTTVTSKTDEIDAFKAQADQKFALLDKQMADGQAAHIKEVTQLHGAISQLKTENDILKQRINQLTSGSTLKPEGPDNWKLPDGEVASILPEENVVFISRGRKDHVLLGLTFEVFSRKTGIIAEETGSPALRGKGTIEVIGVSENSAVCRVVRVSRGQAIVEGDLIGNVVYDPNLTFKFHVHGDFDLDNTGQPTVSDRKRVETMVSQWGGDLVPELTYDVDFLVLGKEPPLPRKPDDELDPVQSQNYAAAQKKFERYQTLVAEARDLKIPILNQNRFVILTGYYQR